MLVFAAVIIYSISFGLGMEIRAMLRTAGRYIGILPVKFLVAPAVGIGVRSLRDVADNRRSNHRRRLLEASGFATSDNLKAIIADELEAIADSGKQLAQEILEVSNAHEAA